MSWLAVALLFAFFVAVVLVRSCAPPPAHGLKLAVQWLTAGLFASSTAAMLYKALQGLPKVSGATVFGAVGAILVCAILLQAIWDY